MKKKRGRGMKVSAMREERARGGFNRKETGGGRTLQFICFALSLFLSVPAPHPMKNKKKELTVEAEQQPRCQRFPLTGSKGRAEKKYKKEETKK